VTAPGTTASGATPVVTIYGTSWCGACRAAREYLTERKIPFADKDVERDPEAARELAAKASKMGIPTDRVPIIDVRGRLLLGFDRARIEALLGQPT
jgi:glutaredoxin